MKTKEELLKEAEAIAWAIDEGLETYSCLYIESFYRKKGGRKTMVSFSELEQAFMDSYKVNGVFPSEEVALKVTKEVLNKGFLWQEYTREHLEDIYSKDLLALRKQIYYHTFDEKTEAFCSGVLTENGGFDLWACAIIYMGGKLEGIREERRKKRGEPRNYEQR